MRNYYHEEILAEIKRQSGQGTSHTDSDSYLGNTHPRYPITVPKLRAIAREWTSKNKAIEADTFSDLLLSLVQGQSSTEKSFAGILLDYATPEQKSFNPELFDKLLDHVEGWAEIDALCSGKYAKTEIPRQWAKWKKILHRFSTDENISKRRASVVFFCQVVRHNTDTAIADLAIKNIDHLKHERHVLITRAISWLLRSMIKNHHALVEEYVRDNRATLPAVAVREVHVKLKTGRKSSPR